MVPFSLSFFPARCLLLKEAPQWDTDGLRSIFWSRPEGGGGVLVYYYCTIGIIRIRIYTLSLLLYWCRVSVKGRGFFSLECAFTLT